MRNIRLHHERLATAKSVWCTRGLDSQLTAEAVDHDVARGAMLRQATTRLEYEQHEPEGPSMNQPCLPMAALRRVRLGMKGAGEVRKIEGYDWAGQSSARMRPEPFVRLIHVCPQR
jgi:hypothetical protein